MIIIIKIADKILLQEIVIKIMFRKINNNKLREGEEMSL